MRGRCGAFAASRTECWPKAARGALAAILCLLPAVVGAAADDPQSPEPQSGPQAPGDAWWTGPLLAASASTLPRGHFLIEPYVFDSIVDARYDAEGERRSVPREHSLGSLAFLLFGITDRVTAGLLPRIGYRIGSEGRHSSGIRTGDLTLQAQYLLLRSDPSRRVPAVSIVASETLPTGTYDRLGDRPGDAFGSGAYATTLALYTQDLLWMPNGRILRVRLDLSYAVSGSVTVRDASVYGTPEGFRGQAQPGDSFVADASWEYSATRHWVLALDLLYEQDGATHVHGTAPSASGAPRRDSVRLDSGWSESWVVAPAIEYNWSARAGVIAGVRFVPAGRRTAASITPVAAVNLVY